MKTPFYAALVIPIALVMGCKHGGMPDQGGGLDSISLGDIKPLVHSFDTIGQGLPIFYNMYLSVEMSTLFRASGAVFKPELLNSADNTSDYVTSSKKALNLGVYAVDLSYSKVFEQLETASIYFNAMQKMAEELGIPADYFENSAARFDRNINHKDSLIAIANEVYMATDKYLRENERYGAAGLIILGGWVEAMQIATDVAATTRDMDIIERYAEQKVSLDNVISMLNDYSGDVVIRQNLQKLLQLKPLFDSFEVKMDAGIDPASDKGKKIIEGYLVKVDEIGKQIKAMRREITSS